MTTNELLSMLHGVRPAAGGHVARCPAHEDGNASLSINTGTDGRILIKCHAGCSVPAITSALKIPMTALFPDKEPTRPSKLVATYDYTDENGTLLYQCLRFDPKDFRQRHRHPSQPSIWIWNLNGCRRVLYRLPDVLAAVQTDQTIVIVEGEKDADNLAKIGLCATTVPMGAGKWLPEYTATLQGAARIIVIADKDKPGRAHAALVKAALDPVCDDVVTIEMPGDAVKDASDWLKTGGSAEDLIKLADNPEPPADPRTAEIDRIRESLRTPEDIDEAIIALSNLRTPADDDLPDPVDLHEWMQIEHPQRPIVIHNLLRTGDKLTLGGGSKSCKTWFAAALGISVSSGKSFLGFRTEKTHVLFINLELQPDIFHERLRTLQANMNILVPQGMMSIWNLRGKDASIERLDRKLKAMPLMPGLIIIDPLYKILGDRVENAAEDMASLMRILDGIALRNEAAILLPAHFSKGNQSEKSAIDRISGSGVFARDADAIVTMTQHEEEDAFTLEFTLRGWAPLSPVVVRWEYPLFQRDDALDPEKLKQAKKRGASPKATTDEYIALVPTDGLSQPEIVTAFKQSLGVSQSSAYSKFNELKRDGLLQPIPFSNRFRPKSVLDMDP